MLDSEGKIRYPEMFNKLQQRLLEVDKDGKPKNSIQIKQTLKEFATEFKKTTQEDYEIPNLTKVTEAVETIYNKNIAAHNAKKNWEETLEEKNKEKLYDQTRKQQRDTEVIITKRTEVAELAKDQFKYKDLTDIGFEEDDVKEKFDSVHKKVVSIMTGKEKPTEYDEFITSMVKSSLYDDLMTKYNELKKQYEKDMKKKYSSVPSNSSRKEGDTPPPKDENKDDPMGFLR
jgi:hypothetical protein